MDIHIILETHDAVEIEQAERLISFLKSDLPNYEPRVNPVPDEVKAAALARAEAQIESAPAVKPKTSKKKTTSASDPRQMDIPGTTEKPIPDPRQKPAPTGDFSTPVLAAQSLARSRKDGVAQVTLLVRDLGAARVSDLPAEKHAEFMSRAQALAAESATA